MEAQTTYFPATPDISFYSELPAMIKPLFTNKMMKMRFMSPSLPGVTLPMMKSKIYWLKQNGMFVKYLVSMLTY